MSKDRETTTIEQRCTLSFSLPPSPGVRTKLSENSVSHPLVKRTLQLPVANTLFQNGKTSTLFTQKWQLQFSKGSTAESVPSKRTWLPQQIVEMGAIFADEGMRLQLDHLVYSHIVPITPARTIAAAVGNIVRKISAGEASGKSAPASEELERGISTAIQQGQIPAQQAGVWALIRPERYAALDRAAQLQGSVRDNIEYAILSGGRLHKVLSGGGGWGEKHGLLALDPDSDYTDHRPPFEPSFGDEQDVEAEKREALGEVAKPGDTITFYVYKSPSDADLVEPRAPVFWNSKQPTATLSFGSLPSSMDAMPTPDAAKFNPTAQSELTMVENGFGMLSEQGMSLESSFINTNITANRIQYLRTQVHKEVYEVRRTNTVTTKLDAPYTLLSIRGQASKVPVSDEVKGEELKAPNMHLQNLMPQEPSTATVTGDSATAVAQGGPKVDDQRQEAQQLIEKESMQEYLVLAEPQRRTEGDGGKSTRKQKRATKLEESKAQSRLAEEENRKIAVEANDLRERNREMSEKVAINIVRQRFRKAANEEKQENYRLQSLANREAKRQRSAEEKAFMVHQKNRSSGETDAGFALAVRFTYPEQEPTRRDILQPEAQNVPPTTIKKHLSVSQGNFNQKHGANPGQKVDVKTASRSASKALPDDVKQGNKPLQTESQDSVLIIREESEGKRPGTACESEAGNLFMLKKHFTMNPFERLQEIRKVGEITSRDQAQGLHSQYHLPLDRQPEDVRKS